MKIEGNQWQVGLISLENLAGFGAIEWKRLLTEVLDRSPRTQAELGNAKGDDVVDTLASYIELLGKPSKRNAAHVLERLLVDLCGQVQPISESLSQRVTDILALLAASGIAEGYDAISDLAKDKLQPMPLRVRAADLLVDAGFRLPMEIVNEANGPMPGAIIGPVAEEMRQRDSLSCLEFLSGAQLGEAELVHIEYPLRRAVRDLGPAGCAAFIPGDQGADTFSGMVRALLIAEFGEDAERRNPGRVVSLRSEAASDSTLLTAAEQAHVERTVSENYRNRFGRVLQCVMGIAKELVPPPTTELRRAVMENLAAGVRYTFYVSKGNTKHIPAYIRNFWGALDPEFQDKYRQMLHVIPYKEAWEGNTLVVYLFGDPKRPDLGCDRLLGLLGSDRGIALSKKWEVLSDDATKTLLATLDRTKPDDSPSEVIGKLQKKLTTGVHDPVPTDESALMKMETLGLRPN